MLHELLPFDVKLLIMHSEREKVVEEEGPRGRADRTRGAILKESE